MNSTDLLFVPKHPDSERDALCAEWIAAGGTVQRLDKFWKKPEVDPNANITIYGNDTFVLVVAEVLEAALLSPNDEMILTIDDKWLKRDVDYYYLKNAKEIDFPLFVKPATPKLFKADFYDNLEALEEVTKGMDGEEMLLLSDYIDIELEVRAFVLDDEVLDLAIYEGSGSLEGAKAFVDEFIAEGSTILPVVYVVDLGFNNEDGWFIIEFNAAWGAGLNNCDPKKVLPAIKQATLNKQEDHERTVYLKDYITKGTFGPIKLGSTKSELIEHFGPYDDISDCLDTKILLYGSYEFFYNTSNEVIHHMQNDHLEGGVRRYFDSLAFINGKNRVDTWFLKHEADISYREVREILDKEQIEYKVTRRESEGNIDRLELANNVSIDFHNVLIRSRYDEETGDWDLEDIVIENPEDYRLNGIRIIDNSLMHWDD